MKKRVLSVLLAIVMVVGMFPVTAGAQLAPHKHPVCGAAHTNIGDHIGTCEEVEWWPLSSLLGEPDSDGEYSGATIGTDGNYYLDKDITLQYSKALTIAADVSLCLNGHTLTYQSRNSAVYIESGATLNICDCSDGESGVITTCEYEANTIDFEYGTVNLYGGTIVSEGAYAIYIYRTDGESDFNQYGGTVQANGTYSAVEVYCPNVAGTYNLYGGTVKTTSQNSSCVIGISGEQAVLSMSGAPEISNASTWEYARDIYTETPIHIAGALTAGEPKYSVLYSQGGGDIYTGIFTDGWPTYMANAAYGDYFVSADPNLAVVKDTSGELKIAEAVTVSFNATSGSGTMDNVLVEKEGTYTLPSCTFTPPTGKQFAGWAQTAEGEVISETTITVSEDTTLYAVWEDAPAHSHDMSVACGGSGVTYTAWDGTGTPNGSVYLTNDVNNSITISSGTVNLCLHGHSITKESGTAIKVESGATLNICDCKGSGSISATSNNADITGIDNSGNVNIYGGTVKATRSGYSGSGTGIKNTNGSVTVSGGVIDSSTTGITNAGGTLTVSGGTVHGVNTGIGTNSNITISGSPNITGGCDINLYNGSIIIGGALTYAEERAISVRMSTPGTFTSDWTNNMGENADDYDSYFTAWSSSYTVQPDGNGELKLAEPPTYTVTYDASSATSGTVPTDGTSYASGSTVTVLGNTGGLAKTGYAFVGWSKYSDASSAGYKQGDTFEITDNMTLYAVWDEHEITTHPTDNSPTVEMKYPTGANYQWYKVTLDTVTNSDATPYDNSVTYDSAAEEWSATTTKNYYDHYHYFKELALSAGDVLIVTTNEYQVFLKDNADTQAAYQYNPTGRALLNVLNAGSYTLAICNTETNPTINGAKAQTLIFGDAVSGQTDKTLNTSGLESGMYACKITYADGTVLCSGPVEYEAPVHNHSWSYSADGATITATCSGAGICDATNTTLTLEAPSSFRYDGAPKEASFADNKTSIGGVDTLPAIMYQQTATSYPYDPIGAPTETPPTGAGRFVASVTVEGQKASVVYLIEKLDRENIKQFTVSDITNNSFVITLHEDDRDKTDFVCQVGGNYIEFTPDTSGKATITVPEAYAGSGNLWVYVYQKETDTHKKSNTKDATVSLLPATPTTYTVSGTVQDNEMGTATVKLMQGNSVIKTTTASLTGSDSTYTGTYSFTDVAPGVYNIVVTKGDVTMTVLVTITDANVTVGTITMPDGKVNSKLEVKDEGGVVTPDVVVDGLQEEAEAVKDANGAAIEVTVTMTVQAEAPDNSNPEHAAIKAVADSGATIDFLDISVIKEVFDGSNVGTSSISETRTVMEIVVPYDFTGKYSVTVYRQHGSEAAKALTKLTDKPDSPADGFFWMDKTNGNIHIYAKKFSTYAIGYTTSDAGNSGGSNRPSGGGSYAHACVSKCQICGGCTDAKCTERVCAVKCKLLTMSFADVTEALWCYDAVTYVYHHGLMQGYGDNEFYPDGTVTRQQVWMILARMSDADPKSMTAARLWAMETGISDGTDPTAYVTRQQFVTMLWRYAKDMGWDVSVGEDTNILSYNDAFSVAEYAIPAMQWACGEGIIAGKTSANGMILAPKSNATRGQLATIMMRFCTKIAN